MESLCRFCADRGLTVTRSGMLFRVGYKVDRLESSGNPGDRVRGYGSLVTLQRVSAYLFMLTGHRDEQRQRPRNLPPKESHRVSTTVVGTVMVVLAIMLPVGVTVPVVPTVPAIIPTVPAIVPIVPAMVPMVPAIPFVTVIVVASMPSAVG
jgi:hypothetical protein